MTIAGLENDGEPVAGLGGEGITLAGQKVAGRDLIDQFNAEVAKAGATFKETGLGRPHQLVAPTVAKDSDGGVHATGPALEIGQVNTTRQGPGRIPLRRAPRLRQRLRHPEQPGAAAPRPG